MCLYYIYIIYKYICNIYISIKNNAKKKINTPLNKPLVQGEITMEVRKYLQLNN